MDDSQITFLNFAVSTKQPADRGSGSVLFHAAAPAAADRGAGGLGCLGCPGGRRHGCQHPEATDFRGAGQAEVVERRSQHKHWVWLLVIQGYYPLSNISTSRNKRTSWQNLEFLSFVHHGINIHHGKIRCRTSWMYVVLIKYGINVHHGLFWITYVRTSWNKHRTSWKLMNSTASVHVLLFDSG